MKNKYKNLTRDEMFEELRKMTELHRKLRFDKVIGHIDSTMEVRNVRRSIARLNTKIHQEQTKEKEA